MVVNSWVQGQGIQLIVNAYINYIAAALCVRALAQLRLLWFPFENIDVAEISLRER